MLDPEQLHNLSRLMLSEDTNNRELALELIKQHPEHISELRPQLELAAYFIQSFKEEHDRIHPLYRRFCYEQFGGESAGYFAIFRKLNVQFSDDGLQVARRLLDRYELVRTQYEPYIAQCAHYQEVYALLAKMLAKVFPQESYADYYFQWYLNHKRGHHLLWRSYGRYCYQQGRIEQAQILYERALQEDPDDYQMLGQLGAIAFYKKDYPLSIAYFEQLLKHPKLPNMEARATALANIANGYVLLDPIAHQTKIKQLIELAELASKRIWMVWNIKGIFLREHLRDIQGAVEAYRNGLRFASNHPTILGNLAELYAEELGDYARANDYYERVFNNSDSLPIYAGINFVAMLVHEMGNLPKAYPIYLQLRRYFKENQANPIETHSITPPRWERWERAGEILRRWKKP